MLGLDGILILGLGYPRLKMIRRGSGIKIIGCPVTPDNQKMSGVEYGGMVEQTTESVLRNVKISGSRVVNGYPFESTF